MYFLFTLFIVDIDRQVLRQTVKTDEMPHDVAFHLGLLCLLG